MNASSTVKQTALHSVRWDQNEISREAQEFFSLLTIYFPTLPKSKIVIKG